LPNQRDRAIAVTSGDWASFRDILIDLATEIDKINLRLSGSGGQKTGDAAAKSDGAPAKN
jgi:hypothetical protein